MVNLKLGKEMENYDFSPRTASVFSGWASERVIQYKFLKSSLNIADVVIFFKMFQTSGILNECFTINVILELYLLR